MSGFAVKRTGDADYPRYLKIMVMGPPKSGKTSFVATAPNVIVAACEAGLMSIAHKNVAYVDIDDYTKIDMLHTALKDPGLRKNLAAQVKLPKFDTVAIDTLDALQEILKKEILREARRTEMQQADWGKLKERMAAILKAYVALPMNVIFTVHSDVTQDENNRQIYAPLLQGSVKNEVAGYVDFSLMSAREKQTLPDGTQQIVYFLKNEGDEKNPHLGNRSAGRVPERCEPNFGVLHKLTFDGINLPATEEVAVEEPPLKAATSSSQVAEEVVQAITKPTGVPASDDEKEINAAGVTALTKSYQSNGLVVPDFSGWSLGEARKIARLFTAVKAEILAGRANHGDLVKALAKEGRYEGEVQKPLTPTKKATPAKKAAVKPTVAAVEETTSAEAEVEKQLGAVVIGHKIEDGAECEKCGKAVDDLDVARIGMSRFNKVLCVDDYMSFAQEMAK